MSVAIWGLRQGIIGEETRSEAYLTRGEGSGEAAGVAGSERPMRQSVCTMKGVRKVPRQDAIGAADAWELDRHLEIAMDALRLPPRMCCSRDSRSGVESHGEQGARHEWAYGGVGGPAPAAVAPLAPSPGRD